MPIQGFDRYRIYREGVWHETMHIKHSPPKLFTYGSGVEHDVLNILEDRRIEDLGVEEWTGYIPERLYTQAYAYALRPRVDSITLPEGRRYESFIQRLLIGKVKGKLSPQETQLIETTAQYVEEELKKLKGKDQDEIFYSMGDLTKEVMNRLKLDPNMTIPHYKGSHDSWVATFTEQYGRGRDPQEVEKDMEEFFKEKENQAKTKERKDGKTKPNEITKEDIEKAREGAVEVKTEYDKVQKADKVDPAISVWAPVASQAPASLYKDQHFITAMNTFLRTWKTGYKEFTGKSGKRLSIPDYIRNKDQPFVTRLKQSVKGKKLLVITDFSGSMHPKQEDYKRALVSAMEVLGGIGCNIALFGFGTDPAQGDLFFRVKTFEEKNWKPIHSAKLAALEAGYGSTPTASTYRALRKYIEKHKPEVTVTVTDGSPDSIGDTMEEIAKLKKHTRMVAFGIAESDFKEAMEKDLKQQGYHKSFAVSNVYDIPPKLVKLLTG